MQVYKINSQGVLLSMFQLREKIIEYDNIFSFTPIKLVQIMLRSYIFIIYSHIWGKLNSKV